MEELLKLVKQCLSIVETSTLKDEEIKLLIRSAILELERSGIDTKYNYSIETEQFDTNVANNFNTTNPLQITNDTLVNDFLNKTVSLESLIEKEIYNNKL